MVYLGGVCCLGGGGGQVCTNIFSKIGLLGQVCWIDTSGLDALGWVCCFRFSCILAGVKCKNAGNKAWFDTGENINFVIQNGEVPPTPFILI